MIVHIGTQLMIMIKYIFYNRKDLIYISSEVIIENLYTL